MRPRFRLYVQATVFSLSTLIVCPPGFAKTLNEYRTPYRDAAVFRDVNNNRSFDQGEPSTTSRIDGSFAPPSGKGRLYVQGGTHVLTGETNTALLTAPPKVHVINTLSSLFQALLDKGVTPKKAKKLLGIPIGVSLEEADAAIGAQADSPKQKKLLQANGKNDIQVQFGKALANARLGLRPSLSAGVADLIDLAATALLGLGQESVDLINPATLQALLANITSGLGRTATGDQLNAAAQVGSAINQQIDAQADKLDSLTIVTANAARELAANDLSAVLSQYTAAGLQRQLDGRFLAYSSTSSTLVAGDANGQQDVFVYDNVTGETQLVSLANDGTQGNGQSYSPAVTPDGRYVAFLSDANNLVAGDANNVTDLFLRDRNSGNTTRISVSTSGTEANGPTTGIPTISDSGQLIAFASRAENLTDASRNGLSDIFLRDTVNNSTQQISRGANGTTPNGDSDAPALSSDGRYIAFESRANNLVRGDKNGERDIFLYDFKDTKIDLISKPAQGKAANGYSLSPTVYSNRTDGSLVVYQSHASNLVVDDKNCTADIFAYSPISRETKLLSKVSTEPIFSLIQPNNLTSNDTNITLFLDNGRVATGSFQRISIDSNNKQVDSGRIDTESPFCKIDRKETPNERLSQLATLESFFQALQSSPHFKIEVDSSDSGDIVSSIPGKSVLSLKSGDQSRKLSPKNLGRNAISYAPHISGNGKGIAFLSQNRTSQKRLKNAKNINEVYVVDSVSEITEKVSIDNEQRSTRVAVEISSEGNYVAYTSVGDGVGYRLYLFNRESKSLSLIYNATTAVPDFKLSSDGTVIFTNSPDGTRHLLMAYDPPSNTIVEYLISGQPVELQDITPTGSLVLFKSKADNLVTGDTNEATDIFVMDSLTQSVRKVSISSQGGQANGSSDNAKISNDGRYVVFRSDASNLVFGDNNVGPDLFLHDLQTGETRMISSQ